MGRATRGVKGINLQEMDAIVGMETMSPDGQVLVVSELGYGKRTAVDQYRAQTRGGKGLINLKVTEKTGAVVGLRVVRPEQDLLLINNDGIIIRMDVGANSGNWTKYPGSCADAHGRQSEDRRIGDGR